jgi:hypothetical protein
VIAKSGKARALLVALTDYRPLRVPGKGRGKWRVKRGFDAPLPAEIVDSFEKWALMRTGAVRGLEKLGA